MNLRIEDITHHPEHYQNSGLSAKSGITTTSNFVKPEIPDNLTLESVILFYENNASGDYENLYSITAKFLRRLLNPKNLEVEDNE